MDHIEIGEQRLMKIRSPKRFSIIALLVLVSVAAITSQARAERSFQEVIQEHFRQWDANHDGKLEATEIDQLMNHPAIQGEAAAALAAIKLRERETPGKERHSFNVNLQQLLSGKGPSSKASAADSARGGAHAFNFADHYNRNLKILQNLPPKLFAHGQPDFSLMHQGEIGDCYFFSITGALAAREPARIKRMIVPEANGSFVVHFFDGETIPIPTLSQAEILVNNSGKSLQDGYWLAVLEKALGLRMRRMIKSEAKKTAEATDAMASGGDTGMVIHLYSGHPAQSIALRNRDKKGRTLEELKRELPRALSQNHLVGLTMNANPPQGGHKVPGLGYNHAYAILEYKPREEIVTIWNPWGSDFKPKGPDGVEHGFTAEHGVIHMPLHVMYDEFSTVFIENPEARKEKRR